MPFDVVSGADFLDEVADVLLEFEPAISNAPTTIRVAITKVKARCQIHLREKQ